jgi:tetratricopeptide (TPR) repeat protein
MRAAPLLIALGLISLVVTPTARAQPTAFVEGVHALANASTLTGTARDDAIRAAALRLDGALKAWDRRLDQLEAQVARDVPTATADAARRLHVELGLAYRLRGRLTDALAAFERAAARQPTADVHVLRALTLEAAGRPGDASDAFVAAWRLDGTSRVTAYLVAQRATAASVDDRARARAGLLAAYARLDLAAPAAASPPFPVLDVIPDAWSRTPVVGDAATSETFALLHASRLDAAVATLANAGASPTRAADPPRERFARGQRYEAENRLGDARREYEAAMPGVLAGRSPIWVGLGRLAQVDGDGHAAIAALEQAARLTPNDPQVHQELADALASQSRRDDAQAELMAALLIDPRYAPAHAGLGSLYLDAGRPSEAVTALTRALELMPARYQTRYTLARALERAGRPGDAARERALFEKARLDSLAQRRRIMASDLEKEDAVRRGATGEGGAK